MEKTKIVLLSLMLMMLLSFLTVNPGVLGVPNIEDTYVNYTGFDSTQVIDENSWFYWGPTSNKAVIVLYGGQDVYYKWVAIRALNASYNTVLLGPPDYDTQFRQRRLDFINSLHANGYDILTLGKHDIDDYKVIYTPDATWLAATANWLRSTEGGSHTEVYLFGWSAGGAAVAYEIQKIGAESLYNAALIAEAPVYVIESPYNLSVAEIYHTAQNAQNTKVPLSFIVHPQDFYGWTYLGVNYQKDFCPQMDLYYNNMPLSIDKEWHTWSDAANPPAWHDPFPDTCADHEETIEQVALNWFVPHLPNYSLTITAGTGGSTNPSPGTYWYDAGTQVQVNATASSGYRFDHWIQNGYPSGSNNPITVDMNGYRTLQPVFVQQYSLIIYPATGGTTSPSAGTYWYDVGTQVQVTAYANSPYYRFDHWIENGYPAGNANPKTVTMDGYRTLQPVFVQRYSLTIYSATGGTTNPSPGTYWYDAGTQVQVTAQASSGYAFDHWIENGYPAGNANPINVTMSGYRTLQPVFVQSYLLTVNAQRAYGGPVITAIKIDGTWYPCYGSLSIQLPAGQHTVEAASMGYDVYYSCYCYFTAWLDGYWHYENPITIDLSQGKTILANYFV